MPFAAAETDPDMITLSEARQIKTDLENKFMVTKGENRREGKIRSLGLMYTHCHSQNR